MVTTATFVAPKEGSATLSAPHPHPRVSGSFLFVTPGVELRELSEASVKMPEAEAPSERVPGAPVPAESRAARAFPCAVGAETAVARGRVPGLGVQVAGKPRASQASVPRSAEL